MKAVVIKEGTIAIEERPDPSPGTGHLLVRVRAAGINNADLLQRDGQYPAPAGSPQDIPGLEFAGEVVSVGAGVTRFSAGDRVMALVAGGAQAELAVVHESGAMLVPNELSWSQAGGFPEAFTTANDALFTQAHLSLGERVLIHGAAGGVGTAAVQIAKAAGAEVIATVRHPEHRLQIEELGATAIATEGFSKHGPFDVILELIGAPNMTSNLESLAICGRICVIGVGGGSDANLNLRRLMERRGNIFASTLRARPLEAKAFAARAVEAHILPLVRSGRIRVPIAEVFPLAKAINAYARFGEGGKFGKLILNFEAS